MELPISSPQLTSLPSPDEQNVFSDFDEADFQTPRKWMSKKRLLDEINSHVDIPEARFSPTNIQDICESPTHRFINSTDSTKRQLIYVKPERPAVQLKKPPPLPAFRRLGNELRRTCSFSTLKTALPLDSDNDTDDEAIKIKAPSTPQPYCEYEDNEIKVPHLPHENENCVNYISPEVMSKVVNGEFMNDYEKMMIIDSRFSFEYEAGHIRDAYNVYDPKKISPLFFSEELNESVSTKTLVIFYCEFSIKRSFEMIRYLRELDRKHNGENYPHLSYPEIYILKDGYRKFHELYNNLCDPHDYTPMDDVCHKEQRFSACKELSTSWRSLGKSFHF